MTKRTRNAAAMTLGAALLLLLAVALLLDPVATMLINRELRKAPGIAGHVEAAHISLLQAEVSLEDFNLQVLKGAGSLPVVAIKSVDVSVDRLALLHRVLKVSARIVEPHVTVWRQLVDNVDPKEVEQEAKEKAPGPDLPSSLRMLFPFKVDEFTVTQGTIRYRDPTTKPPVDLSVNAVEVQVTNFTNRSALNNKLFAEAHVQAAPLSRGKLRVDVQLDPLQKKPTFDMQAQLSKLPIVELNDLLRAYTKFEVSDGEAAVYSEYSARDGGFEGYVKPAFTQVKVHPWKDGLEGKPFQKFWRSVVGSVVDLFKSNPEEQVAAKLPTKGKFEDPNIGVAEAAVSLLKNGFIEALMQNLEHTVSVAGASSK